MFIEDQYDLRKAIEPVLDKVLSRGRVTKDRSAMLKLIMELVVMAYTMGKNAGSNTKTKQKMDFTRMTNPDKTKAEVRPLNDKENEMIKEFMESKASEQST